MGCDIHMVAEVKRGNRRWHFSPPPESARLPIPSWATDDGGYWSEKCANMWFDERSYPLFSVLANVRNGYGFAGVDTGDPVVPIAEPRGLPVDMSDRVRRIANDGEENLWLGDHSYSWLTLSELLAYDWDAPCITRGVVPLSDFAARCSEYGYDVPVAAAPYEGWCGDMSGPGIYTMDATTAIACLRDKGVVEADSVRPHVRDSWQIPIRSRIPASFFDRLLPGLQSLHEDPECVRIVFGFDS